jgi:hypothetical protein
MKIHTQGDRTEDYEPLVRVLEDWLKTLLIARPKLGIAETATSARNTSNRAYSTRSWPFSSFKNLFKRPNMD